MELAFVGDSLSKTGLGTIEGPRSGFLKDGWWFSGAMDCGMVDVWELRACLVRATDGLDCSRGRLG